MGGPRKPIKNVDETKEGDTSVSAEETELSSNVAIGDCWRYHKTSEPRFLPKTFSAFATLKIVFS